MTECLGPQQDGRHARVGLDDLGKGQCPVDGDAGAHGQIVVAQALQARRQPLHHRRIGTGGERDGRDVLHSAKEANRQLEGAQVLLGAEEHLGERVDARLLQAGAVQQGIKHGVAVDGAGGAHFAQLCQLEPQALDDLVRLLLGQRAVGDVALEVGQQRLVGPFRVDRIAAVVELKRQLEQVERLAGLFEVARRMGRYLVQNGGAVAQLGLAERVGFGGGQGFGAVGQVLRQCHQGIAGVNGGAAAVDFVHAAAADGAAQRAGFLFQLLLDGQHTLLHHQLVVGGVDGAVQIQELEGGRALPGTLVVENGAVRGAGLVADNQLVGTDGQRQLAHQLVKAACRFDGGGNACDVAIQPAQNRGVFAAQGAGVRQ